MDLLLNDKKILVTGGSKGIGLACAKVLAAEGADIIISSRSRENLKAASRQIGNHEGELHIFPSDVSRMEEIDALAEFVKKCFGYLDGLIINSGGPPMGSALDHTDEAWMLAVNSLLMPAVRLTRYFVPEMQSRKFGRIISISSTGVKQPIQGLVLSNAIRQAVGAYLKTLSVEVAESNVLINSLLPGATNTDRLSALFEIVAKDTGKSVHEIVEMKKQSIPSGKFGEPANLANIAAFLLSEKNGYITGQSIAVDGGMVLFPL